MKQTMECSELLANPALISREETLKSEWFEDVYGMAWHWTLAKIPAGYVVAGSCARLQAQDAYIVRVRANGSPAIGHTYRTLDEALARWPKTTSVKRA